MSQVIRRRHHRAGTPRDRPFGQPRSIRYIEHTPSVVRGKWMSPVTRLRFSGSQISLSELQWIEKTSADFSSYSILCDRLRHHPEQHESCVRVGIALSRQEIPASNQCQSFLRQIKFVRLAHHWPITRVLSEVVDSTSMT